MSVVNLREKTIHAKVVYYGPPLGGKTTSLKYVHRVMDPERRTQLISLNTEKDRTLFFDFLPINVGRIGEFTLRIQGFTVPGQVKYLLTRRYVLRGADAVVFVADSRKGERDGNLASLRDLRENLAINGLSFDTIPLVLEYNKRDEASAMPVAEMDRLLNARGVPRFETVATRGTGVFEAFSAVGAAMVRRICTEYRIEGGPAVAAAVESTLARVHEVALESFEAGEFDGEGAAEVVVGHGAASDDLPEPEELLERALATNMRVAELLTEVQEARAEAESRMAELSALHRVASAATSTLNEDRVVANVVEGAASALRVDNASILLRDEEDGALRERGVHGFLYDPLVAGGAGAAGPGGILAVLRSGEPVRITEDGPPGLLESIRSREPSVRWAIAAPLRLAERVRGLLVAYFTGPGMPPGPSSARFLGALAASASVALENARLHGALEKLNRELEVKVAERTRELEAAVTELRQLDQLKEDFLSNMSHELMTPLSGIRSSAEILRTYPDMAPGERAEFLGGIEQEAVRLTQRLQDILDLSALDAGRSSIEVRPENFREMAQKAIERWRPALESRRLRLNFWPQTGLPRVLCDARWTMRALDHLLENSVKFSPEGAEVDVTLEGVPGGVRFSVRDRGPGIPAEEREALFRRFKQRGQVLTDKPPGLGAGLPLCRRIAERQGGAVGLEGGPGRGTVAWIRLPTA